MASSEDTASTSGVEVDPMMSIGGGQDGDIHRPIHESMTLAALISGNFGVAPTPMWTVPQLVPYQPHVP